jgi:phospholipase/carboxylesterase
MAAGYQWWPLTELSPQALAVGAASAAPAVDAFIDRKLAQYELSEADLTIVGFSQGTMMALHVGLRRPKPVAAIVGYSGMLTGAPELRHAQITKPPVLLVHGSADPVVPVAALHAAEAALGNLGLNVTTHVANGLGHSVDPLGLRLGCEFARRGFGLGSQDGISFKPPASAASLRFARPTRSRPHQGRVDPRARRREAGGRCSRHPRQARSPERLPRPRSPALQ